MDKQEAINTLYRYLWDVREGYDRRTRRVARYQAQRAFNALFEESHEWTIKDVH